MEWNPKVPDNHFVFVSPSISGYEQESLLFVKLYNGSSRQMRFCGTLRFLEYENVSARARHLRHLCQIKDASKFVLLDVSARGSYCYVDINQTFHEQNLRTGSIIVADKGVPQNPVPKDVRRNLALPPYAAHNHSESSKQPTTVVQKLFCQAMDNIYIDVLFISTPLSSSKNQYRLGAHKNVLATVDHFRTVFESGMKESGATLVAFDVPLNVSRLTMEHFLSFVYTRDSSLFVQNYTIGNLSELI